MKILIGSSALEEYVDIGRKPKDIDYFTDQKVDSTEHGLKVETFNHPDLVEWFGNGEGIATLDELYTIKLSHIFWDLKGSDWNKHCYDLIIMRHAGAVWDMGLYTVLYKIWEEVHGKKKANLNALPEDFFNNNVTRIYDHDSIHASVAYYDTPLFDKILKDDHPILVDLNKWNALSEEDKLKCVREEVYATALERQVIPSGYNTSPRAAYNWALKKTVTSFSKGWFPLFIATHLKELWKPDIDYVKRHLDNSDKLIKLEESK